MSHDPLTVMKHWEWLLWVLNQLLVFFFRKVWWYVFFFSELSITDVTTTTVRAADGFSMSLELLISVALSLLLLVFLITNTMLCCHYRRRHGLSFLTSACDDVSLLTYLQRSSNSASTSSLTDGFREKILQIWVFLHLELIPKISWTWTKPVKSYI